MLSSANRTVSFSFGLQRVRRSAVVVLRREMGLGQQRETSSNFGRSAECGESRW